jgi:plastocyanin
MDKWQNYSAFLILTIMITLGISSINIYQSFAQSSHTEADVTPVAAYIIMTKNNQGKDVFQPQNTTIKEGQEIMILNNLTKTQTFTNGNGKGDSMDGKIFSINIKPNSFAEYLSTNVSPGDHPFYSKNNPAMTGHLIVQPK